MSEMGRDLENRVWKVEKVLDTHVRPFLHTLGGEIEILGVENGKVALHITGVSATCPGGREAVHVFVEEILRQSCSWMENLEVVSSVSAELLDFALGILRK